MATLWPEVGYGEITATVDVRLAGVILRRNGTFGAPAYLFAIRNSASGYNCGIYEKSGSTWTNRTPGLTSCKVGTGTWKPLLVRALGGRLEFYLNGVLQGTYVTPMPLSAAGFGVATIDGAASFDNVKVYGATTRTYYLLGGKRIAERATWLGAVGTAGAVYHLHGDHLGSVGLMTKQDGTSLGRQYYYPFGDLRGTASGLPTDFAFTGERRTAGVGGLVQMGARWYDPSLNRWLSPDTIVADITTSQDWNLYAYVRNNPLAYSDPTGHGACEVCVQGGEGLGGGGGAGVGGFLVILALGSWVTYQVVQAEQVVNDWLNHKSNSSDGSGGTTSGATTGATGHMGSLNPNDPKYKKMVEDILKEHNRGQSSLSETTLKQMLKDIQARSAAVDTTYAGEGGSGSDLPDLQTDITTFQRAASTYEEFTTNLYHALGDKIGQTQNVYMQLNAGLQYDAQTALNEIMEAKLAEGTRMLQSVYLYDSEGNLLASWIAAGGP